MKSVDFRQLCIEWGLETARFMLIADISSGGVTSKSDESTSWQQMQSMF